MLDPFPGIVLYIKVIFLNNILLQRVHYLKDLGIHLTPSLNFEQHINMTVFCTVKVLGLIKCNTKAFSFSNGLRSLFFGLFYSGIW